MRLSAPHHRSISSPTSIPQLKTQVCLLPMASFSKEDEQGSSVKNVAVIGAGVSGLSAAYKLKLHGLNVTVFEADGRVGGKLRSISRDGLIWDEGANTMTESEAPVGFMLDNLGLRDKQQFPLSQHKRYIAKNGVPVLLPSDPVALIRSSFLSTGSKLQIFLEPFLWKNNNASKGPDVKESVGAFFQRHFGKEVVDYLIDPFVAGTSGGDPESLSMQHVFPEIWNLEKSFGSIISGAIQSKFAAKKDTFGGMDSSAKKKQKHGSFSFLGGMQTLTDALCNELGKDELKLQSKVLEITCSCSEKSPQDNWSLSYALNDKRLSSEKSFDALIVTAPLSDVKQMKITKHGSPFPLDFIPEFIATEEKIATEELKLVPVKRDRRTDWTLPPIYNISESLELTISKVSYLPMSVIITTFKRENVKRPLEGFGVLVPSKEQLNGLRTLGTLFSSMMFPDRAPSDVYLYTTFVGGSRNRELAKASSEELKEMVTSDLRQLLGAEGEPAYLNHYYWSKAFPLYGLNYGSVIQAIDKMEKDLPGLFYAGNHKGGLSVGKAISTGCQAADLVISYLDSTSDAKEKS